MYGSRQNTTDPLSREQQLCELSVSGVLDHRQPNVISWDEVIENECYQEEPVLSELFEAKRQYEELRERMAREDPLIAEVFELKEGDGLSRKSLTGKV